MMNLREFYKEIKEELSKVTWPDRKLTIGTTGVVLVLVLVMSIFLGAVDIVIAQIIKYIMG